VVPVPEALRPSPREVPRPPPRPRHPDAPAGGPPQGGVRAPGARQRGDHPGPLLPRPSLHAGGGGGGVRPAVLGASARQPRPLPLAPQPVAPPNLLPHG